MEKEKNYNKSFKVLIPTSLLDIKPSACSTPMSLPKSEDLAVIEFKNFSELITVSGSALLGL